MKIIELLICVAIIAILIMFQIKRVVIGRKIERNISIIYSKWNDRIERYEWSLFERLPRNQGGTDSNVTPWASVKWSD